MSEHPTIAEAAEDDKRTCFFCGTLLTIKPRTLLDVIAINHNCCPRCWSENHT